MPLYDPVVPVRYVSSLLEMLQTLDTQTRHAVLADAGMDAMTGQDSTLTIQQFDALITSAARQLGRTDLGFELGQQIKLDHHQALAFVLRQCPSVDVLLRQISRFHRLITTCFTVSYTRHATAGEFVCRPAAGMSPLALACFEEIYAVTFYTDCCNLLGARMRTIDTYLSIHAPAHRARYRQLSKGRFHFGASALPEVCIVFPAEILDLPLDWAELDEATRRAVPATSIEELQVRKSGISKSVQVSDWVTLMLREAEGSQPTREELADLLNVSPITLTRYLSAEGETLRDMGKRIRHQRAQALLTGSGEAVARISERLGYANCSAFTSAFQALAGVTPRAYRNQLHAG